MGSVAGGARPAGPLARRLAELELVALRAVTGIAQRRVGRACEVGAQALVSACQQCERTLMAAVRRHPEARRARVRVMDITELVCQAMDNAEGVA